MRAGGTRGVVAALALAAAALVAQPEAGARRDRTLTGDVVKATRLLYGSRLPEARAVVADLVTRDPGAVEVRWLVAELAFLDGAYQQAIDQLAGLPDDALDGQVGATRRLAASTLEVVGGFATTRSARGHFVIAHGPQDDVIVELAAEALEVAYDALGDDLGLRPAGPIRVELLARPAELARVSPLTEREIETTGTIALSKYNKLMVVSPRATLTGYPWLDTLCHEYAHLVISQLSHDTVPVWLHEGLARFVQERWRRPGGAALPAVDQQLLATAIKNRRLIELEAMHPSMARLPSQEAAALAYAQVLTLVAWMHGTVGWEGLREVIRLQRDGRSAPRAVAEVMGAPFAAVEKQWRAHLQKLDLSAGRPLAGRAGGRRIRFDKGAGSDDNVGVDEVTSDKARRHARLGGMLRAEGLSEAAALEYARALELAPGDPFVTGKLARTYVELGRFADAAELARPAAALDEQDPAPAVTLGLALTATGDAAGAAAAFEQALRISPFDPAVRCGLAEAYGRLRDPRHPRERAACERLRS
jgi:Flp pilus assembly protein TadD